ncbi:MAG: ABC transporter substrate-binding protein, partial [Pseudolabrys sp.]
MSLSRRRALSLFASAAAAAAGSGIVSASAQNADRHGMSAFGDLKYPADFSHFSYVNPNAPKGGVF